MDSTAQSEIRERLKLKLIQKTGESEENVLFLLDGAIKSALTLTNRKGLIPELEPVIEELSLIMHNREGEEGESLRKEGSLEIRRNELPELLHRQILNLRLAKIAF